MHILGNYILSCLYSTGIQFTNNCHFLFLRSNNRVEINFERILLQNSSERYVKVGVNSQWEVVAMERAEMDEQVASQ